MCSPLVPDRWSCESVRRGIWEGAIHIEANEAKVCCTLRVYISSRACGLRQFSPGSPVQWASLGIFFALNQIPNKRNFNSDSNYLRSSSIILRLAIPPHITPAKVPLNQRAPSVPRYFPCPGGKRESFKLQPSCTALAPSTSPLFICQQRYQSHTVLNFSWVGELLSGIRSFVYGIVDNIFSIRGITTRKCTLNQEMRKLDVLIENWEGKGFECRWSLTCNVFIIGSRDWRSNRDPRPVLSPLQ